MKYSYLLRLRVSQFEMKYWNKYIFQFIEMHLYINITNLCQGLRIEDVLATFLFETGETCSKVRKNDLTEVPIYYETMLLKFMSWQKITSTFSVFFFLYSVQSVCMLKYIV